MVRALPKASRIGLLFSTLSMIEPFSSSVPFFFVPTAVRYLSGFPVRSVPVRSSKVEYGRGGGGAGRRRNQREKWHDAGTYSAEKLFLV